MHRRQQEHIYEIIKICLIRDGWLPRINELDMKEHVKICHRCSTMIEHASKIVRVVVEHCTGWLLSNIHSFFLNDKDGSQIARIWIISFVRPGLTKNEIVIDRNIYSGNIAHE